MSVVKNSEIISYTFRIFIRVIGRRTAENFAIETLGTVIKQLEPTYPFLQYIQMKNVVYSGEMDAIAIDPAIDTLPTEGLVKAIGDLFDAIAKSLGASEDYDFNDAEFYFINEIRDELGEHYDSLFRRFGLALDVKQSDFIINMREAAKIKIRKMKISDLMDHSIRILISLLNRQMDDDESIKTVIASLKKLEGESELFKFIKITHTKGASIPYTITIHPDFDAQWSTKKNTVIESLVTAIGRYTDLKTRRSFIEDFRVALGVRDLSKVKKLGINLESIDLLLQQQIHELLVRKIFEILIQIVGKKTSQGFAVASIDKIIEELREKHDVLHHIQIDKSRYKDGLEAFQIMPGINTVESYRLGKALKEIVKRTQDNLEDKTYPFIEDFKNRIGDDYLSEIEKIGVNLHLLELRRFI